MPIMKKLLLIIMVLLMGNTYAQNKLELGLFLGGSYYMGDLNPSQQFKMTRPAFGGVGRYVFTDRLAVRGNVIMANLAGKYPWSGDKYTNWENTDGYEFSRAVVDIAVMGEFNFMSYDHLFQKHTRFTPYLTLGVGTTCYKSYGEKEGGKQTFILSLPFGLGAKYKVNKWLRLGFEWTWRKSFADDLDVVEINKAKIDPQDPYNIGTHSNVNNNDWYSMCGITVTMSMWPRKLECNDGLKSFNR